MNIIIDGKTAEMKSGSSFEYVAENRHFTGSDSYTMNIVFPLKGSAVNTAIFGHIHRIDKSLDKVVFDARIVDRGFTKVGIITITELSETEVKTQFLEGRSADNFRETLEDIYVNELRVGYASTTLASAHGLSRIAGHKYVDYVALPWVDNNTGVMHNEMYRDSTGTLKYKSTYLSFQPYLIEIAKRIIQKVGYSYDFTPWEQSGFDSLIICNMMPSNRTSAYMSEKSDFCTPLPHWTVIEFFEQIGRVMDGEFEFDHELRTCRFRFNSTILASVPVVALDNVTDEYTGEVSEDSQCTYLEHTGLAFSSCSHRMWNFYSCDWFTDGTANVKTFETIDEMVGNASLRDLKRIPTRDVAVREGNKVTYPYGRVPRTNIMLGYDLFYCKDVHTYFVLHCYGVEDTGHRYQEGKVLYQRVYDLMPVNVFGQRKAGGEGTSTVEIRAVPAWLDYAGKDQGRCLFLDAPSIGTEPDSDMEDNLNPDGSINWDANSQNILQNTSFRTIRDGSKTSGSEYYDKLYLAFWDGVYDGYWLPCPIVDAITMRADWSYYRNDAFSMRINEHSKRTGKVFNIDGNKKYTFKFISNEIPNPRSIFYIRGQKYLCEKITSTFKSDTGLSNMMKGIFYKII